MNTRRNSVIAAVAIALTTAIGGVAGAADYFEGRKIYASHCESCHGSGGESMQAGVPSFADGDGLFKTDSEMLDQIRSGSGTMPAFRGILDDAKIRDVIAYVRSLQQ